MERLMLQLSNVSSVSIVPLGKMRFPWWTAIPLVGGMILKDAYEWLALLCFAIGIVGIVYWYLYNSYLEKQKRLIIITNSGRIFSFVFHDMEFLQRVYGVLDTIIAKDDKQYGNIQINIENSTIKGAIEILNDVYAV